VKRFQVMIPDELFKELQDEARACSIKEGKTVSIARVLRAHAVCDINRCAENKRALKKFLDTVRAQG